MTPPAHVIRALNLPEKEGTLVQVADDQTITFRTFSAIAKLDAKTIPVDVYQAEGEPLVDMAFLTGFRLTIEVTAGGAATVERLP